ncbi:Vi polysaccharide transport protein VexE [Bordetella sp. LUAb4]|uniref:Vi polysaccharide transport protein VexE n=1 Tax=Bordetella sp. LUAb4 TaxID=2843195 RepID=UPI001E61C2C7|nr:Vi polysaccharide transport protein VexE [Bordetella sp. LUAb4]
MAALLDVIKAIRGAADPGREMPRLAAALAQARPANGRREIKRLLVSPFVKEGAFAPAIAALDILVDAYPSHADDHRMLASLLGRTEQWDRAIAQADTAGAIEPDAAVLQGARIQLRLQAGRVADAAAVARATLGLVEGARRNSSGADVSVWMLAFMRNGDTAEAAEIAAALDPQKLPNERVATMAVRALLEDGRVGTAVWLGAAALSAGHDCAALRTSLGQAYLKRGSEEDRKVHALAQFEAGLALAPTDVRLLSLHGETLLRAGRYKAALAPLKQAVELAPDLEQTRGLYARALRYSMQYGEAADQMKALLEKSPDKVLWQRATIGALSQAGRKDEAHALFKLYVAKRGAQLPETFQEALAQLEERLDTAPIPRARFDWAWSLRGDTTIDRAEWERKARWGHLIDHLLFDWLECREDQVEEAMTVLGDLDRGERFFAPLLAAGRGVVVATAHVGPMYAGLMALELLGIPSRWLATAPTIAQSSYAPALISTADQTEAQVAKACLRALGSGYVLCLAIDGAANPAAPRTTFEGQDVTYSSFAAHMAHRLGVPSVFYAPRWEDGHVTYTLEMLPAAKPGEDAEAYAQRWQQAYFERLREHLAGPPENLRMSGGIWRHVQPADRSALP